jgi:hypothetical protein
MLALRHKIPPSLQGTDPYRPLNLPLFPFNVSIYMLKIFMSAVNVSRIDIFTNTMTCRTLARWMKLCGNKPICLIRFYVLTLGRYRDDDNNYKIPSTGGVEAHNDSRECFKLMKKEKESEARGFLSIKSWVGFLIKTKVRMTNVRGMKIGWGNLR